MNDYISVSELAKILGISQRTVQLRAKKEDWQGRKRQGRGGGLEYPLEVLPWEWQAAIRESIGGAAPKPPARGMGASPLPTPCTRELGGEDLEKWELGVVAEVPSSPHPTPHTPHPTLYSPPSTPYPLPSTSSTPQFASRKEQRTAAKLEILRRIDQDCPRGEVKIFDCYSAWCRRYNAADVGVPDWVREVVPTVCWASIQNWRKALRSGDVRSLGGRQAGKLGAVEGSPELVAEVEAVLASLGRYGSPSRVFRELQRVSEVPGARDLTLSQVEGYLKKLRREQPARYIQLTDPLKEKNAVRVAMGSRSRGLEPNQLWEIDSSATDIVLQPSPPSPLSLGRGGTGAVRWCEVGVIDVATRRAMVLIAPTSKGEAIALLLIRAMLAWGMPKKVKTDNGNDYISRRVQDFLTSLNISIDLCIPGNPQEKPHIERFFGTFNHQAVPLLPGFVGHSVSERRSIREARGEQGIMELAMTAEEFQVWADQWCCEYEAKEHEGIVRAFGGEIRTPMEAVGYYASRGWKYTPAPEKSTLEALALPRKEVTVTRTGIRINNREYVAPELARHVKSRVVALVDALNPNEVRVFSPDMQMSICTATWSHALSEHELARVAKQAKVVQSAAREGVTAAKRQGAVLERKIARNPEILLQPGSVRALVGAGEAQENPIVAAVQAALTPSPSPHGRGEPEDAGELARQEAEFERLERLEQEARQRVVDLVERRKVRFMAVWAGLQDSPPAPLGKGGLPEGELQWALDQVGYGGEALEWLFGDCGLDSVDEFEGLVWAYRHQQKSSTGGLA